MKKFYIYTLESIDVDGEVLDSESEKKAFDTLEETLREFAKQRDDENYQVIGYNYVSKFGNVSRDIVKFKNPKDIQITLVKDLKQDDELDQLLDYFM